MEGAVGAAAAVSFTVVLIAIFVVIGYRRQQQRIQELAAWAHHYGWTYTDKASHLRGQYSGSPFAGRGSYRHAFTGQHRGRQVMGFEYSYTTSSQNSSTTHYFQVVAIRTPAPCPRLEVTREHFGHKLLSFVGVHDLQLGYPDFDDTYRIRTDNDDFARHVLHPQLMQWMLLDPRTFDHPFRFEEDSILTWRPYKLDPDAMVASADYLIDLLERTPPYIWGGPAH